MPFLKRNPLSATTMLPDGYVAILLGESRSGFTLPPAGALLWEYASGNMTLEQIIEAVGGHLAGVDKQELRQKLESTAKTLIQEQYLLEVT